MQELEIRFYPREEIAAVLSINLKDSKHFKRNLENKLSKLGYSFRYIDRQGVEILSLPEKPEVRLKELTMRFLGQDVQIDAIPFACFVAAFAEVEGFACMPWRERTEVLSEEYGYRIEEDTLRNWCSRLVQKGIMVKGGETSAWKTTRINDKKIQEPVQEKEAERMSCYKTRRTELVAANYKQYLSQGMAPSDANGKAWDEAYKTLWTEYGCCYYNCESWTFTAYAEEHDDLLQEIYELARMLAPTAPPPKEPSSKLPQSCVGFTF